MTANDSTLQSLQHLVNIRNQAPVTEYHSELKMSPAEPPCLLHMPISDLKTVQIWGSGSCICLKQMRNACRVCMFSIAFIHFYASRGSSIDFSAHLSCPEALSNAQHESSWPQWDQMIKSCLYTVPLMLPSFARRTGNGMLRMEWSGLFTYAFISSLEGKATTFNKTFTTVQISVSLHPHFPCSVKLYEDALHFLLPTSSLPIPPLMQTIKAGLLGAPQSGCYFQSSDVSL